MASSTAPILDLYAPLSHKGPLDDRRADTNLAPSWVPVDDRRRLNAYKVLAAYRLNKAREFLPAKISDDDRAERREYGDADLLVTRVRAGVLGDGAEIIVEGAEADLPDEPPLPPEPDEPGDDATDVERRVAALRAEMWEQAAAGVVDDWERDWRTQPQLQARQEWLRQWARDEGFWSKVHEAEGDAVGLGDGVYTLAWSAERGRVVLKVYDPGFYFPVLVEGDEQEFPEKVHLAWEFEDSAKKRWLRRLTWELGPIFPELDDDGQPVPPDPSDRRFVVRDRVGTRADGPTLEGRIVRDYPWNVDDEGRPVASGRTCYFTDATWSLSEVDASKGIVDLSDDRVQFARADDGTEARQLDLRLDFLPVVHVPNTPASREHFGASVLLIIAQLLDDIGSSDTDVQAASALAAGPMVALFGAAAQAQVKVQPGTVWTLPKEGKMDVLDLSAGLEQLRSVNDGLRDLLSVNSQVSAELLGRLQATQDRSGISIALSFGPFAQLVGTLRMTREAKYELLLKFVQRIAQGAGVLDAGANPRAVVAFGPFLPTDRAAVVTQATSLLNAGAASTQSVVAMLVDAGFTIDDARGEVERIHAEQTAKARELADATGSEQLAADWLGLELPEQAAVGEPGTGAPEVTLPPAGGQA